jgi:serine/threonine protein kinase
LGICLFELEAGYPPFENTYYCEYWKAFIKFIKEDKDRFWRWNVEKENFKPSKDFKELLAGMLNPDLEKRFTIDDVINSKYYKSCLEAVGASAASPFKKHKKRKSNKRVRGQRTSRRKASVSRRKASVSRKSKRGSARARRIKTAL